MSFNPFKNFSKIHKEYKDLNNKVTHEQERIAKNMNVFQLSLRRLKLNTNLEINQRNDQLEGYYLLYKRRWPKQVIEYISSKLNRNDGLYF